jgi:hypothetical protein
MRDGGGSDEMSSMSDTSCPTCGQTLTRSAATSEGFRTGAGWTGEAATDEIYTSYLRSAGEAPVSRRRFVADLAYLGVEEVLDDETHLLVRT